jgi:hypothetical protein
MVGKDRYLIRVVAGTGRNHFIHSVSASLASEKFGRNQFISYSELRNTETFHISAPALVVPTLVNVV